MKRVIFVILILIIPSFIGCSSVSPEFRSSVQKADIAMEQLAPRWKTACDEKAANLAEQAQSNRRDRETLLKEAQDWKNYGIAATKMREWVSKLRENAEVGE